MKNTLVTILIYLLIFQNSVSGIFDTLAQYSFTNYSVWQRTYFLFAKNFVPKISYQTIPYIQNCLRYNFKNRYQYLRAFNCF